MRRTPRAVFAVLALLLAFLLAGTSGIAAERFSVGYLVGDYDPSLRTLQKILANPRVAILEDPNYLLPRNRLLPVEVRNIRAPELSGDPNYGIQVEYLVGEKVGLVATLSLWHGESFAEDTIQTFIRQDLPPVDAPRAARYNLSLSQIWLGWKYRLYDSPQRGRLFLDFGIIGLAIADLTMDTSFKVLIPDTAFAATSSTEANGIAYTTRLGIGGEYFFTKWFSFGVDTSYVVGNIVRLKVRRHFRQNFAEVPPPPAETTNLQNVPPVPPVGETIQFAPIRSENVTDIQEALPEDLPLELNGFQITSVLRFYF